MDIKGGMTISLNQSNCSHHHINHNGMNQSLFTQLKDHTQNYFIESLFIYIPLTH